MMSDLKNKLSGAKDKVTGEAKEKYGKATNDKKVELEGKLDKAKGTAKEKYAELKDKMNHNEKE